VARFGKYELIRKLATGGMAEVFLARFEWARGLEKTVVVKRILPHLAEDESFREMFFSEAKLASQLSHPGIAQIIEFGEHAGTSFLSMEYVDGPSLRQMEHNAALRGETLPFAHSARIAASCCEALAYAHDLVDARTGQPLDLVHRDVSPDNILISRTGAVKLVDFGIAKAATQTHRTETGGVKGKLGYMSPEQLRARALDRRTDVYALGVVLYEMLAGARPYEAPTEASLITAILTEEMVPLRERFPDVPESLDRIVRRALQRRPEDRYPDCRAMHDDLEAAIRRMPRPATVFQLAQLVAQDSETDLARSPGQLVTPERGYPTARTPVPWKAEGTDAKGQALRQAEALALTGTEDTYKRPAPPPEPLSGPLALLAPAKPREGAPALRRTSPTDRTRSFAMAKTEPDARGSAATQPFTPIPAGGGRAGEGGAAAPAGRGTPARRLKWVAVPIALVGAAVLASIAVQAISRDTPKGPVPLPPPRTPPPPAGLAEAAEPPLPALEARETPEAPQAPVEAAPATRPRAPQKIAPVPVELVVSSDPPSRLRILSGRKVLSEGKSPIAVQVPPGAVTVEASATGANPWFKQETLTLGAAPRQVSHTVTIEQGSVFVRTFPASRVTVDGVPRGDVPLQLNLFQGPHLLRLECDPSLPPCADRPAFTTPITIEPGKSLEVMHKW